MAPLKIVAISDTHNAHDLITIPECDILIHAGDESYRGSQEEIENFAKWFDKQPAKHLVWTPGNHSVGFAARYPSSADWVKKFSPRTNILINSDVTLEGVKIWGSPVTPWFHDWAYNEIRGAAIRKYWDMIPKDTSIVVTHGPPYGVLDEVDAGTLRGLHVGCEELLKAVSVIKPKLHIFGHIHEGSGIQKFGDTTYVNAAIMDRYYDPSNEPRVIQL